MPFLAFLPYFTERRSLCVQKALILPLSLISLTFTLLVVLFYYLHIPISIFFNFFSIFVSIFSPYTLISSFHRFHLYCFVLCLFAYAVPLFIFVRRPLLFLPIALIIFNVLYKILFYLLV